MMTIKKPAMSTYLEHPLLKPHTVEKRLFQMDLAASALKSSSLIVVPTGLGKTVIALMVLLARLDRDGYSFLPLPSLWWSSMPPSCAMCSRTEVR